MSVEPEMIEHFSLQLYKAHKTMRYCGVPQGSSFGH